MTNQNDKLNKGDDIIIILHGNLNSSEQEKVKGFVQEALAIDEDGVTCISNMQLAHRLKGEEATNFVVANSSHTKGTITEAISLAYNDHKEQGDEQTFVQIFIDHITAEDLVSVKPLIAKIAEEVKDSKSFKIQFLGLASLPEELKQEFVKLDDELAQEGIAYDIIDYASLEKFATLEEAINHSLND